MFIIDIILYTSCNYNFNKIYYPKLYQAVYEPIKNPVQLRASIICLCRDISNKFKKSLIKINNLASRFKDYRIVIVENDSKDNSRKLLCDWATENKKTILLKCDENVKCSRDCITGAKGAYKSKHTNRITRMAEYRNKALKYIKNNKSFKTDVVIVYDFDLEGNINMNEFDNILNEFDNWDAVFANGRMAIPPFDSGTMCYDGLAFRENWGVSRGIMKRIFRMNYLVDRSKNKYIPVASAFNGLGVYKYKSIKDSEYSAFTDPYNCEHVGLHYNMYINGYNKLFINKKFTVYTGKQGPSNKWRTIIKSIKNPEGSGVS